MVISDWMSCLNSRSLTWTSLKRGSDSYGKQDLGCQHVFFKNGNCTVLDTLSLVASHLWLDSTFNFLLALSELIWMWVDFKNQHAFLNNISFFIFFLFRSFIYLFLFHSLVSAFLCWTKRTFSWSVQCFNGFWFGYDMV